MKVSFADTRPSGSYALAIPVWGEDMLSDRLNGLDENARTLAARSAEAQRFEREPAAIAETFVTEGNTARRLLLVGLGGKRDDEALYEKVGGALAAKLLISGETRLVVDASGTGMGAEQAAKIAFGAAARSWRYDIYRTKLAKKQKPTLEEVVIVGAGAADGEWQRLSALLEGLSFTRELVTEPANVIYPETFVERARAQLEPLGAEIQVMDEKEMAQLGMGALLGVGQGSVRPPRLLTIRWNGAGDANRKPVVFVGKGITFDTGGISIKPAAGMEAMKWDMGGAGAVAGAMKAIAMRKAKANVIGICVLAENMPDGNAQRPGDVVTSMSGQTIEVINTDAEGRLVLADAMTWAQRTFKPEMMVDLATLTGAMIIALGYEYAGLFSNDDGLAEKLTKAGQASGDKLWRFPLGEAYDKQMDSQIADMKNAGPREGGSIMAATFLQRFVEDGTKWAHLDIAGTVWANKPGSLYDKGATGYGVALLDRFVSDNFEG
ncbi:MAG: Cytosol aminopeptidase PepA [uncultured Sphingosinicella sp.]|uniref:Probable cytosol aminopeptidase n=1 Tax=uncultured Sphingosinicella sp. TaxID=478748 RepID=A0A6J4U202_9SPHN|nr:leucyl aminopeptidase [uncultured Sphingosinicella sp.]CAA9538242.1 MAG: Cytosol aminopeptidase PepA [uncultured Sphingosinicella sp.]